VGGCHHHTGGSVPTVSRKRAKVATAEDKIESLVSAHQTKQAMQRATGAPPPPVVVVAPETAVAPEPQKRPFNLTSIVSWVNQTLFGSPNSFDGLGQAGNKRNIIIPIIAIAGLILILRKYS
jgi:hypothetical protein